MTIEIWLLVLVIMVIIFIIRDVFYRYRFSKRIFEAQKMESIGRLAGGVAHDFNNMLTGINSAASFIDMQLGRNHELHKYTKIISDSCIRAAHLTNQLLMFSRTNNDSCMLIDVHDGLEETVYLLEHGLPHNIKVLLESTAEKHVICGYTDLIHNLILNLGFNSKDAMPQGGEIIIKTSNVSLSRADLKKCIIPASPKDYLEIMVSDTGHGIPKAIQGKLFEPFFTTKAIGKGTGLGLAAVYGIVKKHEGTISFESSSSGTIFKIYLPLAPENSTLPVYQARFPEHLRRNLEGKILIVDDEALLLEVLSDILKSYGSEIISAQDSLSALDLYQNNQDVEIVMLDVIMPKKSGVELYHELRQLNPNLKIVFMSGYTSNAELDLILHQDENTLFLQKPYQISDVVDKLAKLLAKN